MFDSQPVADLAARIREAGFTFLSDGPFLPHADRSPQRGFPADHTAEDTAFGLLYKFLGNAPDSFDTESISFIVDSKGPWLELFFTEETLVQVYTQELAQECDSTIALVDRRVLPNLAPPDTFLYQLLNAVAETHSPSESGWHIHLIGGRGLHLPYRFLFDPARTQRDLAWEAHGEGRSHASKAYGDPSSNVLTERQATAIHRASLAAVQGAKQLAPKHRKFSQWAKMFVKPGRDTYRAHPATRSPTKWMK